MTRYSLSNVPNQSFTTTANGHDFEFVFHTFRGRLYADAIVDGILLHSGATVVANGSLFCSEVNNLANGEFMFVCTDWNEYPNYEVFDDINCFFAYKPY